jgi:hypothetical protein
VTVLFNLDLSVTAVQFILSIAVGRDLSCKLTALFLEVYSEFYYLLFRRQVLSANVYIHLGNKNLFVTC